MDSVLDGGMTDIHLSDKVTSDILGITAHTA
jgi:hypothetical protein